MVHSKTARSAIAQSQGYDPRELVWCPKFIKKSAAISGEHESIERIAELAELLKEHGKAFAVYYQHYGSDTSAEDFQDCYMGQYQDEEDFVYQMWDECGRLKQLEELNINESYIDWSAIARDWFIDSYHSVEVGYHETYVFSRH
ncbi:antirestriction protein ArdA [Plectonema radiosum NIES-515]|uniref:Antirestriction protein ArdA n=1 Tax=Plectonema radiosum NIES-515 TaxID=2986073 RepID=A0ABT3AYV2_9CYAN|nr:antirestriction protein ArdA [Plectonema radiosum]MCV3214306.1 antirestriction protein ArdA [Plectonema radiosum NIES-515]